MQVPPTVKEIFPRVNTRQEDSHPRFDLRNKKPEIVLKKSVSHITYDTDNISIIV